MNNFKDEIKDLESNLEVAMSNLAALNNAHADELGQLLHKIECLESENRDLQDELLSVEDECQNLAERLERYEKEYGGIDQL